MPPHCLIIIMCCTFLYWYVLNSTLHYCTHSYTRVFNASYCAPRLYSNYKVDRTLTPPFSTIRETAVSLQCTAFYSTEPSYTLLQCNAVYCSILRFSCTGLYCIVEHCVALFCTAVGSGAVLLSPCYRGPLQGVRLLYGSAQ